MSFYFIYYVLDGIFKYENANLGWRFSNSCATMGQPVRKSSRTWASIQVCLPLLNRIDISRNNIHSYVFCCNKLYLFLHRKVPGFDVVGQNIKRQYSTKPHTDLPIKKAVDAWFKEKNNFDKIPRADKVSNFVFQASPAIGHYTQLVWADTYKVILIVFHFSF